MKDKIKNIFFWIWWGLLILLHVFLYIWLKVNGSKDIIIPIAFIIIWWILTLVPLIIKEKLHKKRVKSNEKMYISQIIIEDEKFGKIVFEHNIQENTLLCKNPNVLFGKSKPKIHIINYVEKDKELYFSNLRYVYDNQEKILKDYYNKIKIMCDEWEEHDSNGKPVTNNFVEENTEIFHIYISKNEVSLEGLVGENECLLGDHSIIANINCKTKEVNYTLEG